MADTRNRGIDMAKVTIKHNDLTVIMEDDKDLRVIGIEAYNLLVTLRMPISLEPVHPTNINQEQKESISEHPQQAKEVLKSYA